MKKLNRRDFLAAGAGGLAALGMRPQDDDGLVVHEWGVVTVPYGTTYSNLRTAGSKSVGGMEVDPGLPSFVLTWDGFIGCSHDLNGDPVFVKKPVVYFYSKKKVTVSVEVSVPTGAPAAWWPPGAEYVPRPKYHGPSQIARAGPAPKLRESGARNGSLHWKTLTVDPGAKDFQKADGWWEIARETDATPVIGGKKAEKFLFYDALAIYNPGIKIEWKKGGKVRLANPSPDTFRHVFVVRVKEGKCSSAYRAELAKGEEAELTVAAGLPKNMAETLIESGLYKKEAEGLVEIWHEEFFRIDGTRILMVVPRETYDTLLPIEIKPEPKELKRVLIAHIECLDAERQEEVSRLIEKLGSDDLAERDAVAGKLEKLGPLAEPHIRAAAETAKDPELKARLQDLLKR